MTDEIETQDQATSSKPKPRRTSASVNLSGQAYQMIKAESERTRASIPKVLKDSTVAYLKMRNDILSASDGAASQSLHAAVLGSESRLAAMVARVSDDITRSRNELQILTAFCDTLALHLLYHLPEVTGDDPAIKGRKASAVERHDQLRNGVAKAFDARNMPKLYAAIKSAMEGE